MRNIITISLISLFIACQPTVPESFSFKESDYKFSHTFYHNNFKIADIYVNKTDPRLTMERYYWDDNNNKKVDHFLFNKKQFGPQRYYDGNGNLFQENLLYNGFDSTRVVYFPDKQVMERKK